MNRELSKDNYWGLVKRTIKLLHMEAKRKEINLQQNDNDNKTTSLTRLGIEIYQDFPNPWYYTYRLKKPKQQPCSKVNARPSGNIAIIYIRTRVRDKSLMDDVEENNNSNLNSIGLTTHEIPPQKNWFSYRKLQRPSVILMWIVI